MIEEATPQDDQNQANKTTGTKQKLDSTSAEAEPEAKKIK